MAENGEYGWNDSMGRLLLKLKEDLKTAMRAKDEEAKNCIRQIMSEFFKITEPITLESGKKSSRPKSAEEITDDDILGIISGLVKSEKVLLEAKKEESSGYLELLQAYLPQMATKAEILSWIRENIDFSQYKNTMQAMGPIMKHFGNAADGTLVKKALQEVAGQ